MKNLFVFILAVFGGAAIAADVNLKAQHAVSASSTLFAVQTTKNTSTKGNMLSVRQTSSGALSISAPTIELNRQLVSPGDSMVAGSAISAGATGVVSYGGQILVLIGDNSGDYKVDGTPDVGAGGAAADVQMSCVDWDPDTGDWVTVATVTNENLQSTASFQDTIGLCVGDLGGTPTFRAVRGSVKSEIVPYPW